MLPALVWAVGIYIVLSMPSSAIPKSRLLSIEHIDKVIHFLLFFVFCFLLCYGFFKQQAFGALQKHYLVYAILISIIYGGLTEILQALLLASRYGNIWDFFCNSAGAITGALVFSGFVKSLLAKNSNANEYY